MPLQSLIIQCDPATVAGICAYEIDIALAGDTTEYLYGFVYDNMPDQPGPLGASMRTISLATFCERLAAYVARHDLHGCDITGHITLRDGIAFSASNLMPHYLRAPHA